MELRPILFVDDDSDDRFLLNSAFSDLGYHNSLSFAENGEKALRYLEDAYAADELPKLIILDLNMPKMSGTQVLKAIKANTNYSNISVIIFSTAVNEPEKKECFKNGAGNYLVKPINYSGFLETAKQFYNLASA